MSKIKVGDVFTTNQGCECVVVEYINAYKVKIKFLDEHGYKYFVSSNNLKVGRVKNPYYPSVFGVGYLGVGEYKASVKCKVTKEYATWRSMLNRCYSREYQERYPTYKGCYVHKDWHNFQNFARWFDKQHKESGWNLDKDILKKGNKEYSSKCCKMVPREVNMLLLDSGASRGELPLGVSVKGKGFRTDFCVLGKQKHLGTYPTPTEAFLVYKKAKELQIKEVANLYKDVLCEDIYNSLMSYQVECSIYDRMKGNCGEA